ncbi:MAG: hypothetical protein L0206_16610 [Actinobacteria bacterium]|nr:hypothetical protein [Actinomycetota bacterium]
MTLVDLGERATIDRIVVGPNPHGIAAPADGSVVFVSLESDGADRGELLWIDPRTRSVRHRLAVGPEPHAIAVTPDGRWVYVPCRDGDYWVIDAERRRVATRIRTGGRPHNTQATADGRWMVLSPMAGAHQATVVDVAAGHRVVARIAFGGSPRPAAVSSDDTLLFQQIDGLNGFQVARLAEGRVVATVEHETPLGWFLLPIRQLGWLGPRGLRRCHGIAARPRSSEVWAACGERLNVHAQDPPRFRERSGVDLPGAAYWLTFDGAGRTAVAALANDDRVAIIDAALGRVVSTIPVGRSPKRNLILEEGS